MENRWEPLWFEGSPLSHPDYAVDESREVDESGTAEGPGTINESEIVESEEAHFGESEEINENYSGQEEHSSEYTDSSSDSSSDSNDNANVDFWLAYDTYSCLILIILFWTNDILKFLPYESSLFVHSGMSPCQSFIASPKGYSTINPVIQLFGLIYENSKGII